MDNIFLENVSQSYILDKELKTITVNEIFNDLINLRTNIRDEESDFNFINDILNEQNNLTKIELLYGLLDTKYCKEDLTDILTSTPGLISMGVAGIAALYKGGILDRPIASLFGNYIATLHNIKKYVVKTKLFKMHKEMVERYNIVETIMDSNYSQCYTMCSPDADKPEKNDILKSMAVLFDSGTNKFKYDKSDMQSTQMCTLTCVLDYLSSAVAQISLIYDRCLTDTGERNPQLNRTIATIMPIGSECKALREDLNELMKKFNLIVGRVYHDNPRITATWQNILEKKISDVKSNRKITNYGPLSIGNQSIHHDLINFNSDSDGSF